MTSAPLIPFPAWDDTLFVRLNGHAHLAWLDAGMRQFTTLSETRALILACVALVALLLRGRARRVWIVGILALGLSDAMVDLILKPWIHRPRPFDAGLPVRALARLRHSRGFPSAHASNFAALACAFLTVRSRAAGWAVPLALIAGYSRIYVGVHRPLDVLGGWIYGSLVGLAVGWLGRGFVEEGSQGNHSPARPVE